jgi:hypothetical protein
MGKLDLYRSFLKSEGFVCEVHDDYIAFRHEGGNYVLTADDADPTYFQLIFPKFWTLESPEERQRALEVASKVNMMVKGMKIFDVETDTCASIELFLPKPEDFKSIFRRALRSLQMGTQQFRLVMGMGNQPGIADVLRRLFGAGPDAKPAT